ncbi:MAG TPA: hypothetical protein VL068_06600, partial [Microthrixaceae bacterium]|nr:hypothetical protein [Microthrixaceae bacterium]
ARFVQADTLPEAVATWILEMDDGAASDSGEPRRESNEVALTRFSTGSTFEFSVPTPTPVSLSRRQL